VALFYGPRCRISTGVKEGSADCIRIDEIVAALKKVKDINPRLVRASSRNNTSHRGYCVMVL